MKKLFLIVNPCAGMRKANRHLADIIAVFNRRGFDVITYITHSWGGAAQYAKKALRLKKTVIPLCDAL